MIERSSVRGLTIAKCSKAHVRLSFSPRVVALFVTPRTAIEKFEIGGIKDQLRSVKRNICAMYAPESR